MGLRGWTIGGDLSARIVSRDQERFGAVGAPQADYGPHKTIYNRRASTEPLGVFNKIFAELAGKGGKPERIMIDATHLKAHRSSRKPLKKGPVPRRIGRTKGGLNSKLHAVCDEQWASARHKSL